MTATLTLAGGRPDTMLCIALLCLLPMTSQLVFMFGYPAAYMRHRESVSFLCRLPQDAWLVLWQEVPELGVVGPWLRQPLARTIKLEFVAVRECRELDVDPRLPCLPTSMQTHGCACCCPCRTLRHDQDCQAPGLLLCKTTPPPSTRPWAAGVPDGAAHPALLPPVRLDLPVEHRPPGAAAAPVASSRRSSLQPAGGIRGALTALYRKEVAQRRAFALVRVRGLKAHRLTAWVDAVFAPLDFPATGSPSVVFFLRRLRLRAGGSCWGHLSCDECSPAPPVHRAREGCPTC